MATILDAEVSETVYDKNQGAYLCMLVLKDGSQVELISGPVVDSFIKKSVTYYHVCYAVDDINLALEEMKEKGATVVSTPKEAILFSNKLVAFIWTPIGLVELVENSS